jgi:hypothetical protein
MSHVVKLVVALGLAAAITAGASSVSFAAPAITEARDFLKFAQKSVGPHENDGTPRLACLCKAGGLMQDALGFIDVEFGFQPGEYLYAVCRLPFIGNNDPVNGPILSLDPCLSFQILPR